MSGYNDAWVASPHQLSRFPGMFLLEWMVREKQSYKVWPEREDYDLKPTLDGMYSHGWLEIENDRYFPSKAGWQLTKTIKKTYEEFLYSFDVFCGVDIGSGEFAFERYFDFSDDSEWQRYLQDDRFVDLRIAVMEYLDIDAVEVVMMQFLCEYRYGKDIREWKSTALSGQLTREVVGICNDATDVNELGFRTEQGEKISGESVVEDVEVQGAKLLGNLLRQSSREMMGISPDSPAGGQGEQALPVKFPPANHFNFDVYSANL